MPTTDCNDSTITNIKTTLAGYGRRRRYSALRFDSPVNPVPGEIRDAKEYRRLFGGFQRVFVPYAGNERYTSHALLNFLYTLAEVSPTQSGVIGKKARYAFGGKVKVVRRQDKDFDIGEVLPVDPATQTDFIREFLPLIEIHDQSLQRISVRDLARFQFADDEKCGNFYFEIVKTTVGSAKNFKVYTHDPRHCAYLPTDDNEPRYIAITPIWTIDYLLRNPPAIVSAYPNWQVDSDGTERTIVHIKNGNYVWYGRPGSIASILDQYLEFQNADYKCKHTSTSFMGQALIEIEAAPGMPSLNNDTAAQESGFGDATQEFADNFTNVGDNPQRVLLMERPVGAKEAFVHEFDINTHEGWFTQTGTDAEANILKSHDGFPKLLFTGEGGTGFSTQEFLQQFEVYDATTNKDIQTEFAAAINDIIFKEAVGFFELPQYADLGIQFTSPFADLLKKREDAAANVNISVGGSEV
jgi:hypothetical protein